MDRLARRPGAGLVVAAALTALLAVPAAQVRPRYEVEDFFPAETPARAACERAWQLFGRDDRTALLVVEAGAVDGPLLARLRAAGDRLARLPQVERVLSPAHARIAVRAGRERVRLEEAVPPGEVPDAARVAEVLETYREPPYVDALVSADGGLATLAVVLREDRLGFADRGAVLAALEEEAARLEAPGLRVHLAGYPVQRVLLSRLAAAEARRALPLALAVLGLVLLLAFRGLDALVLPLAAAGGAAVWTTGVLGLVDLPPNVFGPAVYVMIAVAGVASGVHLLARQRELLAQGLERRRALARALDEVLPACAWASLTTAFGFSTLVFTGVPMVAHMGLQVAVGVVSALVLTALLLPACALWLPAGRPSGPGAAPRRLAGLLARLDAEAGRRPGAVVLGFALLAAVAGLGAASVRVDAPLLADLDPDHPLRVTNRLLEERLGGAIPVDVLVEPPPPTGRGADARVNAAAYARERLARVDALTRRLRADPDVRSATSAVDLLRRLVALLEQVPPEEAPGLLPTGLLLVPEQLEPWLAEEADVLRIRLRVADLSTADALELFGRIRRAAREELGEEVALAGQGTLAQTVNADLVRHFATGFAVAVGGIALLLLLLTRSPRLAAASLAANALPVLGVAGAMGLLGIDLRYTSALVLTVVFGLAVDDTIHVVAQLRRQAGRTQGEGGDPLRTTLAVAGPGLILTSATLTAGAAVLLTSAFLPLRVLGGLLALSAGLALAADLLLLPAILRLGRRRTAR